MFPVPRKPHDTRVSGGVASVVGSVETMMLSNGDQRLWLQGGHIYDESGIDLGPDEVPGWFEEEYKKLTPLMKSTHPIDGSAPAGKANLARRNRIEELKRELESLETAEINSASSSVNLNDERPVDETDEEFLHSQTKDQLIQIAADEDLEVDGRLKKDDLIAAILAARAEKAEG